MVSAGSSKSLIGGGCLALFGLPFLAAGVFLSFLYFSGYVKWWNAKSWVETPCWIESAELEKSGSDSDSHRVVATYRYEFAGRFYQGDRVSLYEGSDNVGEFQQESHSEISRHVKGASSGAEDEPQEPFRCYVNPQNPSEAVIYRTLRWPMQVLMSIFALTFPAVGAGLVLSAVWGTRMMRKEAALSEKHPGEPWKWKSHWAGATIDECPAPWRQMLILYTLWSAVVIFPLILATALSGAFEKDRAAWLLLIFVAIWCVPAWFAGKRLRQFLLVGQLRLELQDTPASPGGVLRGSILFAKPLPPRVVPELHLYCEKRITRGSGEDKSTVREKIWSARETLPQDRITRDFTAFRLPVNMAIPPDGPESSINGEYAETYAWNLALRVPGTAVHSVFEIPVFRNGKSPALVAVAAGPSISETIATNLASRLAEQRIQAEFDHAGMPLSITRPAAQHRSMIVFLFIFNLVWTMAAVLLIRQKAPLLMQVLWMFSATAIWVAIFWQIIYRRAVTFTRDSVRLRHRFGPFSREETIQKSQIASISHDTNMSSNNAVYYRVRLIDVLGKKKTLADGIAGSTLAEALAGRLEVWRDSD